MRHYAFQASKRNVNTLSSEHISITSILQAAAGCAWTRRYHARSILYANRSHFEDLNEATDCAGPSSSTGPTHHIRKLSIPAKPHKIHHAPSSVSEETLSAPHSSPEATKPGPQPSETLELESTEFPEIPEPPSIFDTRPQSCNDLLKNIVEWRTKPSFRPRSKFNILHAYHNRHPHLRSMKSFRVLAEISIDEANVGGVRKLFGELHAMGKSGDWNLQMWAIWVRWMVRQGKWETAWDLVMRRFVNASEIGMPLKIWVEFWGTAKLRTVRRMVVAQSGDLELRSLSPPHELYSSMKRYHLLVNNAPNLTREEMNTVHPMIIYAIVRIRVWNGKREWAMDLTRAFFHPVDDDDDGRHSKMCLRLLNLHLGLGWKKMGFPTLRAMRKIMDELLELNPRVKPNSRTVVLLLAALKNTRTAGINANRLIKELKERYGESIEDQMVRYRVLSLAAKEGSLKVLHRLVKESNTGEHTGFIRGQPAEHWYRRKLDSVRNHVQKRIDEGSA